MTWNGKDNSIKRNYDDIVKNNICRVVKRFALFPINIDNTWKCFEVCYIIQRLRMLSNIYIWENVFFTDKSIYKSYKETLKYM